MTTNQSIDLLPVARGVDTDSSCRYIRETPPLQGCEDCEGRYVMRARDLMRGVPGAAATGRLPHSGIPMLFHQTWPSMKVHEPHLSWVGSWFRCLPHWKHVLWTDDDIRELFATRRPELVPVLNSYPYGVEMADVIRYLALHEFGGLYADMDYTCVRGMDATDALDGNFTAYARRPPPELRSVVPPLSPARPRASWARPGTYRRGRQPSTAARRTR